MPPDPASKFDEAYYKSHCGAVPYERNPHWLNFFAGIASEIARSLKPQRVFDAGCAWGFLVEAFRDSGIEACGVDLSPYAIANVRPDMARYCRVGSLTEPIEGNYDLVTCIEVLEHMPESEAGDAIRQISLVTDTLLFSSTPDDFDEPTHINVHPLIYWLKLFAGHGFAPDLLYDASFISPHAFLLRRSPAPLPEDVLLLFSETLRNRIYRVAFLERQTRLEELESERQSLHQRIRDTEATQKAQQELSTKRVAELENSVEEWRHTAHETRASLDHSVAQQGELSGHLARLRTELQAVYSSPGWRLITRYRAWLQANYWRRAWVRKSLEPALRWVFGKMGISALPAPMALPARQQSIAARDAAPPAAPAEPDAYQRWIEENEPSEIQLEVQRRMGRCLSFRPKISVITPIYRIPQPVLEDTLDSVFAQTYENWELCLVHADTANHEQREYLTRLGDGRAH